MLYLIPLFFISPLLSQGDSESPILVEYAKQEVELERAGSYFNVLRLKNNDSDHFTGMLTITVPDKWLLLGPNRIDIILAPGQERLIPVRVSMPPGTLGGISYVLNADLAGEEFYAYTNAFVSLSRKSDWTIRILNSRVYLSEFDAEGNMSIQLKNRGNTEELIKLNFRKGRLVEFANQMQNDSLLFVRVPAYSDTTIRFIVRENSSLSYNEQRTAQMSSLSKSIYLTASTNKEKRYATFRIVPLKSERRRVGRKISSPLNLGVTFNNMLSTSQPNMSLFANGKVLFSDAQRLTYNAGFQNIYFNSERMQQYDLFRMMRYTVSYSDPQFNITSSNRIGAGSLHVLSGLGLKSNFNIKDRHTVSFNAVQNPYNRNLGAHVGYGIKVNDKYFFTGFTMETPADAPGGHYSFHLGSNFTFLQDHKVDAEVVGTLNNFPSNLYLQNDTSVVGLSYRIGYRYSKDRLRIRGEQYNTLYNYLRISGFNRTNLNAEYTLNKSDHISANYFRTNYTAARYPYNFVFPSNLSLNDNIRLYYIRNMREFSFRVGPQIFQSKSEYRDQTFGFNRIYHHFEAGVFSSATFRIEGLRSITPSLTLSAMRADYETEDPNFPPFNMGLLFKYRVGFNYYDQSFKLNAYFSSGEALDLYRTILIDNEPEINQSVNVRPYYERYFNNEQIRLSGYMNLSYFIPSLREVLITNITGDFYVEKGWNFYASLFMHRNVRVDEENGRIALSNLNMLFGVRKSFDIQQPKMGLYDLTIVGFNDSDGDGLKGLNEKPISNVLINISRDPKKNVIQSSGYSESSFITNTNGEIFYEELPEGIYDLTISPLTNLGNLYFLNGENQSFEINKDLTLFLPLVESYKIAGRIIVDRDPNSSEGQINLEGIRITAAGDNGENYSTLTNGSGLFVLALPESNSYTVSINNVFGEQFRLDRSKYRVQFSENRTVNIDFKFRERRRGVNVSGEQLFDFNLRERE